MVNSHLVCNAPIWRQLSPSVRCHNPATGFWPPSATMVSTELFSHRTGTMRCLQKEIAISSVDLCPCGETQMMSHIVESCPLTKLNGGLSPAALSRRRRCVPGWPVMVHDTPTRRRRKCHYRTWKATRRKWGVKNDAYTRPPNLSLASLSPLPLTSWHKKLTVSCPCPVLICIEISSFVFICFQHIMFTSLVMNRQVENIMPLLPV